MSERVEKDRRYRQKNSDKRKAYQAQWRLDNSEHLKRRAADRRATKRAMCLIASARVRARKRGVAFDLHEHIAELQARIDAGRCEVTGIDLDLTPGRSFASPSIDRIDPAGGYVFGNVRITCHAINAALGDWGEAALARIVVSWLQQHNAICAEAASAFISACLEVRP
jgi:hypothetical protein